MIANHEGRVRRPEPARRVRDLDVPELLAREAIEREQVRVGCREEHGAAVHGDAAVADVERIVRRVLVAPDLPSRARVDGPEIVGRREVHDAVDENRRGLDLLRKVRLERPGEAERVHVVARDLRQRAVAPARIVAVIRGPAVRLRVGRGADRRDRREFERCASHRLRPNEACAGRRARRASRHPCSARAARRAPRADRRP